jgi:hypothetical protein
MPIAASARAGSWLAGALACCAALCGGCRAPAWLEPARGTPLAPSEWSALKAERVEVETETGEKLRGYFVPAGSGWFGIGENPDPPVVVHFLAGGQSVTRVGHVEGLELDPRCLAIEWWERGYDSLIVDYREIGDSDGSCDARHLREDARAVWREAPRRTQGDRARFVLRGNGVGTLAVASLLEDGARPVAAILIGPVRAESWTANRARAPGSPFAARISSAFSRAPVAVDLLRSLESTRSKLIVFTGSNDAWTTPTERAAIVRSKSGRYHEADLDRAELDYAGCFAHPGEVEWLDRKLRCGWFVQGFGCAFPTPEKHLPDEMLDVDVPEDASPPAAIRYLGFDRSSDAFWADIAERRAAREE